MHMSDCGTVLKRRYHCLKGTFYSFPCVCIYVIRVAVVPPKKSAYKGYACRIVRGVSVHVCVPTCTCISMKDFTMSYMYT